MQWIILALMACGNENTLSPETQDSGGGRQDTGEACQPSEELCDGLDQDCDGRIDEGLETQTWYTDADGDGIGDSEAPIEDCAQPAGTSGIEGDCDDGDPQAAPGLPESPSDGRDSNCDGEDGCSDLNCDGLADLVFFGNADTAVFLQTEAGFGAAPDHSFALDSGYRGTVADVDRDGFPDLLPTNTYDSGDFDTQSAIYWGGPTGLDSARFTELSVSGPKDVAVADLDGDGWPEVVYASTNQGQSGNNTDSQMVVFTGSAEGPTGTGVQVDITRPERVQLVDVDQDGWTDIVGVVYRGGIGEEGIAIVYNQGGDLSGAHAFLKVSGPLDVAFADLNQDGDLDMVVPSYAAGGSASSTSSKVFYGTEGRFETSASETLYGQAPLGVDIADFNQDGWLDVAFGGYRTGKDPTATTTVHYGSELGFNANFQVLIDATYEATSGDLNGDGYADLVVPSMNQDSTIYWGGAAGLSTGNTSTIASWRVYGAETADLDGDGLQEVILSGHYDPDTPAHVISWGSAGWARGTESRLYSSPTREGATVVGP